MPDHSSHPIRLLHEDLALARRVPARERAAAEAHLLARTVTVAPGGVEPAALAHDASTFALLLVAGMLRADVDYAGRRTSEMLVPGDVLLPHRPRPDGFDTERRVAALSWSTFAVLDRHFMRAATRWPGLMVELHQRLSDQEHRIAVNGAIGQLPRTDDRILAAFRQLAFRLGEDASAGTVLPVAMTHAEIGQMIGASRPTVSLALTRLAAEGRLERRDDGSWLLRGEPGPAAPTPR